MTIQDGTLERIITVPTRIALYVLYCRTMYVLSVRECVHPGYPEKRGRELRSDHFLQGVHEVAAPRM